MATNTAGSTARELPFQLIHYLRKRITFADNGRTVVFNNPLPAGAVILKPISGVQVNVAFDGNATNTVSVGPSTDSGTDLWATSLALGTIGFVPFDELVTLRMASDTLPAALVTSTAAATVGDAELIIAYLPNNDG
jgi:hypothetical protein